MALYQVQGLRGLHDAIYAAGRGSKEDMRTCLLHYPHNGCLTAIFIALHTAIVLEAVDEYT
jgi:hypothetical protein